MKNNNGNQQLAEIYKWIDEPSTFSKGYTTYGFLEYNLFIFHYRVRIKIDPNNHRCWRHTPIELIEKFSGRYSDKDIRRFLRIHLESDYSDEDDIIRLRQFIIEQELSRLLKKKKLAIIPALLLKLGFKPSWRFQGNHEILKERKIRRK